MSSPDTVGLRSSTAGVAHAIPYTDHRTATHGVGPQTANGWQLLADEVDAALSAFAIETTDNPTKGLPKAGFAIAQAFRGNDARAIWAMRRALEFEPRALHYAPLDERLHERLEELTAGYSSRLDTGDGHPSDDLVMIAALAYMQHDYERALEAATEALRAGDRQATTRTLVEVIEEQLGND